MHRPHVSQRLCSGLAVRDGSGGLRASAVGVADRLDGTAGQDHRGVRRRGASLCARPRGGLGGFREGPAQGRRDARAVGRVHRHRGGGVHWPRPGEDGAVSHREAP